MRNQLHELSIDDLDEVSGGIAYGPSITPSIPTPPPVLALLGGLFRAQPADPRRARPGRHATSVAFLMQAVPKAPPASTLPRLWTRDRWARLLVPWAPMSFVLLSSITPNRQTTCIDGADQFSLKQDCFEQPDFLVPPTLEATARPCDIELHVHSLSGPRLRFLSPVAAKSSRRIR